ncbi:MAG: hypothetical protein HYT73_01385 [Candidatus Aenigmarchaeota archaeon]|nr:hypothetical protein [Candidatus Aenigmarchaeota archaeon]
MEPVKYTLISGNETELFSFFCLNLWLQSRIDTDNESDGDEEVNTYVSGVLYRDALGMYMTDGAETRLRKKAVDVELLAETTETPRERHGIYARNADLRFLNDGIYDDRRITGCGDVFYENAAAALEGTKIRRNMRPMLDRLSSGYLTYVSILRYMKAMHLDMIKRLSQQEVASLQNDAQEAAVPYMRRLAYAAFTDAYADARNATEPAARAEAERRANTIADQLRGIDPGFRFDGFQ